MIYGKKKYYPADSPQGRAIAFGFLLIGLLISMLGYPGTREYRQIRDELVQVPAVITRATGGRKHRTVLVTYTYGGTVYEDVKLNATSSDMAEGDQITVPIHPDDPGQPVYNTMGGIFGFGVFYSCFSLLLLIAGFWPRKPKEKPPAPPQSRKKRKKRKKTKKHR